MFYLITLPYIFDSCHCHFSVSTRFDAAVGGDTGMPVLENITDEEEEKELAGESREVTSMQTKLKVP